MLRSEANSFRGVLMPSFDPEIQRGLDAFQLATKYAPQLTPRLPQGHVEWLAAQLQALGAAVPQQKTGKLGAQVASSAQDVAAQELLDLISAMRTSVKENSLANAKDKKACAVGVLLRASSPKGLVAAADTILAYAAQSQARVQLLGLLPADFTRLQALRNAAASADAAEDQARSGSKRGTQTRDATVKNVTDAVKRIGGAGTLAFADKPAIRAEFAALLAPTSRSKKPAEPPPTKP